MKSQVLTPGLNFFKLGPISWNMRSCDTILGVTLGILKVSDAIDELKSAGANLRCNRLVKILKSLKFEVKDSSRGNHKTFMHPQILHFYGGSFDCGHKSNGEVKRFYVNDILKILIKYKDELEEIN